MRKFILVATATAIIGLSAAANAGPYIEVDVDDLITDETTVDSGN